MFIIKTKKNVNRARLLVEIFGDNLPLIDREPFLPDVTQSGIFYSPFLYTINLFGIDRLDGEFSSHTTFDGSIYHGPALTRLPVRSTRGLQKYHSRTSFQNLSTFPQA